jgi:endonuclease/exonuclease/phosphatase family metal-dependent hydrolase
MVAFPKPDYTFNFDVQAEIDALLSHKQHRNIPAKDPDKLLVATWNIANLGLQQRNIDHYKIIAEVLSWFDVIAIQEVHENLEGLFQLESFIGTNYDLMFNDVGGNDERAAFFYDANKVERLQMVGELSVPPSQLRHIKISGVTEVFTGFDRNPYVASFMFKDKKIVFINAHLFFGGESASEMNRRGLEAYAVGRYADLEKKSPHSFADYYFALGDFNIPKAQPGDPIFDALTNRGLVIPEHSTRIASSIMSDAQYDQVLFFPDTKRTIKADGVFDYDQAIFAELYDEKPRSFKGYCRYYISDHRPMWVQIEF